MRRAAHMPWGAFGQSASSASIASGSSTPPSATATSAQARRALDLPKRTRTADFDLQCFLRGGRAALAGVRGAHCTN
eukprot:8318188-Alexandrium_andersonii.AAC.1